jgi:hypothetical protein
LKSPNVYLVIWWPSLLGYLVIWWPSFFGYMVIWWPILFSLYFNMMTLHFCI